MSALGAPGTRNFSNVGLIGVYRFCCRPRRNRNVETLTLTKRPRANPLASGLIRKVSTRRHSFDCRQGQYQTAPPSQTQVIEGRRLTYWTVR